MPTFAFAGGVNQVDGWGQRDRIRFLGTWAVGDSWTLEFTTNIQGDFTIGQGALADATYNFAIVHADRVYIANGAFWSFSALLDPTGWEEQDVGSGFQAFTSNYGVGDSAISFGITQGRLAVFGRRNIQIWQVDANPANFARIQILQNAGTFAKDSVQSIGELDVYYLDDTGIRSLRTKEANQNAYVDDIGSAIDKIVQEVLAGLTEAQKQLAMAIVEPTSKRYMLFIPTSFSSGGGGTLIPLTGSFYVLSNFPSSKVRAWSTYTCSLDTGEGFSPWRLMLYNNKVLVVGRLRTPSNTSLRCILLGGEDGETYDETVPIADLPWIAFDQPATVKQACGLHAAFKGAWKIYASMNPTAAAMTEVVNRGSTTSPNSLADSTYDIGHFNYQASGTHLHLKAIGTAAAEAQVLSMLSVLYNDGNKK